MQYIMTIFKAVLFVFIVSIPSQAQEWVKNGDSYVKDGQVTLKRADGSNINVSLNGRLPVRQSLGRTPNIMVIGGGGLEWGGAILSSDGNYYVYNETLGDTLKYTPAEMADRFDYTLGEELFNWSYNSHEVERTGTVSGSGRCGNQMWVDEGNSCTINSCSFSGVGSVSKSQNGSSNNVSCQMSRNDGTNTWAMFYVLAYGIYGGQSGVNISVQSVARYSLPAYWKAVFGVDTLETVGPNRQANQRDKDFVSGCNGPSPGTSQSCNGNLSSSYSLTSKATVRYYFDNNWRGNGASFGAISSQSSGTKITSVDGTIASPSLQVLLNDIGDVHYGWGSGKLVKYAPDGSEGIVLVEGLTGVSGYAKHAVLDLKYSKEMSPPPSYMRPPACFNESMTGVV